MPKRHRKMKGGFLDSIGTTLSGWGSSISEKASSAWNSTKKATTDAYDSATGTTTTPTYVPTTGGRKRSKRMRGGFSDNTPTTGLAAHASPISGVKTAQPHNLVGGRTRKHRRGGKHRHGKSCKHRKH
jgi:hypothetical protein